MANPCPTVGKGENVDSRALDGLLYRVNEQTFRVTYSIAKIEKAVIAESFGVSRLFSVRSHCVDTSPQPS